MRIKTLKNKLLIFILLFLVCACATESPVLSGIDGSSIPPAFSNFPDVPFPEKAYMDLADSKALGSGENWVGSVSYTAPYNASRLYDFYVSEMPKLRWNEIAIVRSRISQMTYVRDTRAIQILIESLKDNESKVMITAIPNKHF